MDIMMMVLVGVFICVGVALVVVLIELTKILKTTNTTITDVKTKLDPVLDDVAVMTNDLKPAVKKADPLVDRLQLTLDAVNLEMMRVDEILEHVAQITDTASSATTAVDNIAHVPVKAVSNVATRVRTKFGTKYASEESAQLGDAAVNRALEDYKAAQAEQPEVKEGIEEPNFEGLEKIVADSVPIDEAAEAAEEAEASVNADGVFGEEAKSVAEEPAAEAAAAEEEASKSEA